MIHKLKISQEGSRFRQRNGIREKEEPRIMDYSIIKQISLFSTLPPEEIQLLDSVLRLSEFPAGAIIFREKEINDRFTIILEGRIHIIKALETPDERLLDDLGPGDFMGEMSLFEKNRTRSASALAQTRVLLLEMTRQDFESLIHRQPQLALNILQIMSERLRNSEDATIRDLQQKNNELAQAYLELKAAQAQLIEKEKLEHELSVARTIQERILPKEIPALPGWRLSAYWQPARAVGGDYYDFIDFPDGKIGLIIGDVTGKGVPAALVMATTRSVIHAVVCQAMPPGELLAAVNNLLYQDMPANMFVTCFYAVLDPSNGLLRYANAGQNLPVQRTDQGIVELRATGMPLGLMPEMSYEEKEAVLSKGDVVLLYSDGLVEAHDPNREMFGTSRLHLGMIEHGRSNGSIGENDLIHLLLNRLANFTGAEWEQEDDLTFVSLERLDGRD